MDNYFTKLLQSKCDVDKKNGYNYVSWANGWAELKKVHPEARYTVYENSEWNAFFESKYWIDVKVWVTVGWLEHIIRLPVLDFSNKSMKDNATSFDINKSIMRALAKAIAMHWIWLYVYQWEDLPDTDWEKELKNCETLQDLQTKYSESPKTKEIVKLKDILKNNLEKWTK